MAPPEPAPPSSDQQTTIASDERIGASDPTNAVDPDRARPAERYVLGAELGRGGMGVVYRARDTRLRRAIAVKVLRARPPSPSARARFVQEAQVTGQLAHPCIPPVHDIGELEDGQPFFAMKVVQGESLRSKLDTLRQQEIPRRQRQAAFSLARRLDVLTKVGEALAYAHAHGVVHRDLKPENVMIGEFGEVQVMDWGLAKLIDSSTPIDRSGWLVSSDRTDQARHATIDGDVAGTPGYMAPEQARGEVDLLDVRTDVFALGVMLYEMLALARPYAGATEVEILAHARTGDWIPIDARLRASSDPPPTPPPELVAIAGRAMAPEPDGRYASVGDLLADLRAFAAHERVRAYPGTIGTRLAKAIQRHPRVALGSLVALVVAILGVQIVSLRRAADAERYRAALAERGARDAEALKIAAEQRTERLGRLATERLSADARAAISDFHRAWTEWDGAHRGPDQFFASYSPADLARYLAAYDALFEAHAILDTHPSTADHFDRALLRQATGDYQGAIAGYADSLAIDGQQLGAIVHRGICRSQLGDYAGAATEFDRALEINPRSTLALLNRAVLHFKRGDVASEMADYDRALEIDPDMEPARMNRGFARKQSGDLDGALADYDRVLARFPGHADAHFRRGWILLARGERELAMESLTSALTLDPRHVLARMHRADQRQKGGDAAGALADYAVALELDPRSIEAWTNRGIALMARGDLAGARDAFDAALAIDPAHAGTLVSRGALHIAMGDYPAALADLDRALASSPRSRDALANRGVALLAQGNVDLAIATFDALVEHYPNDTDAWTRRGEARQAKRDWSGAVVDFDRAIELAPRNDAAVGRRGVCHQNQGDRRRAIADYRRALEISAANWVSAANLGALLVASGERAEALRWSMLARRHCPDAETRERLARTIRELGGVPE